MTKSKRSMKKRGGMFNWFSKNNTQDSSEKDLAISKEKFARAYNELKTVSDKSIIEESNKIMNNLDECLKDEDVTKDCYDVATEKLKILYNNKATVIRERDNKPWIGGKSKKNRKTQRKTKKRN